MSTPLGEAIRVLGIYTAGRFDAWMLAGSARASCRAHVMSTLLNRRVPQSQSGVNAIRDAFYRECGIDGECPSEREEKLRAFCATYEA